MAKQSLVRLGLCLVVAGIFAVGCVDPLEVDEAGPCEGNHAPHIGGLSLVVDHHDDEEGFLIEEPPNPDSTVFVSKFDTIVVWFEFLDRDCNLAGGRIHWALDGDLFAPVETIELKPKKECDGIGIEKFLGQVVGFALPKGYGYQIPAEKLATISCDLHEFEIGITDACNEASSETITGSFFIRRSDCF